MDEELWKKYRTSSTIVRSQFHGDEQSASTYYASYIQFALRSYELASGAAEPPIRDVVTYDISVLDVGCGCGWSAHEFANRCRYAAGLDLNIDAFEPRNRRSLGLVGASATAIPFRGESFDLVSAYQVIEHVPSPISMLDEMLRVCRPGGVVCIVGPNLLSVMEPIKGLMGHVWKSRPVRRIFVRDPDMPRHPHGDTVPEMLLSIPRTVSRLIRKRMSRELRFDMREPDKNPPFHGDNDACYVANPIDLERYFSSRGCVVLQNGAFDRPAIVKMLARGTWFAARKPH